MNKPRSVSTPKAVQDCHQLLEWMIPLLDKFPRVRRFTLGERIEQGVLTVLEELIRASYGTNKVQALTQANISLDVVRHLWRLSFQLKVIPVNRYDHGSQLMEALGRQIGGWRKQQSGRSQ